FLLLAAHGLLALAAEEPITLESPRGGWNYSGMVDRSETTGVAYPTPPIDRGAQRNRTMIQGRIRDAGKDRRPASLIANGNAMPLYTGDEGRYARYYAFGGGSNSIEVRAGDGK